jgi:hypothetical protein
MATQEQDFNKETNKQSTLLFIKDSEGVTIDLTEVQCAQMLQSLLTLSDLQWRPKSPAKAGEGAAKLLRHVLRQTSGEMQDIEVNSLLQGQAIHIENCRNVRISVQQFEVEKVVEFGLAVLRLLEHQVAAKVLAGDGAGTLA